MQRQIAISCMILMTITVMAVSNTIADAAPFSQQNYWNQLEEDDPEALLDMLARLRHSIMRNQELENNKRGLDLGLSRGFSGSQAAKHLMGLAAANYAGGPGRRRRSE
ncbi:PREDICTED: diuretic hormone class 2 [Polistes dominula]|uniref:Diuretic hormone class 2 n=1 Tax=Polistes dominula TaxID=743375 RepID=A0ABM1ITH6_POLDO|nr:PREDICTED: diuretic hormone class 2 [Polistes dominula]